MIKNILVAIDGSEHARSATEHALWIAERLKFLRDRLAEELSADDRKAIEAEIEAEIEVLSRERGLTIGGRRIPRILRRLRRDT